MDDKNVRQPADRAYRAQRSAFEIVASKLRPPPARPGAVGRPSLIGRLMRDDCGPVVSVVGPGSPSSFPVISTVPTRPWLMR